MSQQQLDRNILITGGAGYIGSHAVRAFLEDGWQVTVLDDLSTGRREAIPADVPFVEGDIADTPLLGDILKTHGITAVVHFAGSVVVPESVENPLKYYLNNTAKSRTLIEAFLQHGGTDLIFSSTAAVYGIPEQVPVSEDTPLNPINPYGASKMMIERMVVDTAAVTSLRYGILRYFNVAGADPEGRTGQSTPAATHLIKVAVQAALGRRPYIEIFGDDYETPDGTGVRDYIHVSDLALAHVAVMNAMRRHDSSYLFNCGYGQGFSVREVLDMVERVAKTKLDIRILPRRAGDPPALIADASKISQTIGWRPRFQELEFIVKTALDWERGL